MSPEDRARLKERIRTYAHLSGELKKLGVNDVADVKVFAAPHHEPAISAKVERLMSLGLAAEVKADYPAARDAYLAAHRLDPADPTPLRFLGETYRHHLGQWDLARSTFEAILVGARSSSTGAIGDGKVFVLPMDDCIRIRTGERGKSAIGP